MANELVNYDALFAEEAARQAAAEKGAGTQFLSTKGRIFSYGDSQPVPENTVYGYVLASLHTNVYYATKYGTEKTSPTCYAFSETGEGMVPHDAADVPQCESCDKCKMNQYGTSETGRGKACSNTRRLNIIFASAYNDAKREWMLFDDPNILQAAEAFTLSVPVTSVKGFARYVSRLSTLKRPLWSVVTKITMEPSKNPNIPFLLAFDVFNAPDTSNPIIPVLHSRATAEREAISFPFPKAEAQPEAVKKTARKTTAKKAPARKAAAKKGGKVPF